MSDWEAAIPLSLFELERDQAGNVSPHFVEVYLERGLREIESRVVLLTPGHMPCGLSLTLAEGERLSEMLSSAVHLAGGVR